MKICFVDTETTGLDAKRHGIIQIAAIMEVNGVEAERFETFIRPAPTCACDARAW
jgi:DNA polymerase III epsilon subunit-like protein